MCIHAFHINYAIEERCLAGRYEVQGEYVIPPNATIPLSAADMALVKGVAGGTTAAQRPPFEQSGSGRWRVQARHSQIGPYSSIGVALLLKKKISILKEAFCFLFPFWSSAAARELEAAIDLRDFL